MKRQRKVISAVLAVIMLLVCTLFPVSAVDVSEDTTGVVIDRVGNEFYIDGVKIATLTVEYVESENQIMPRTGWIRTETCPYGTASEYTLDRGTVRKNLRLENAIINLSVDVIMLLLEVALEITPVGDILELAAGELLDYVQENMQYASSQYIYCEEHTYGHNQLAIIYRKIECSFFLDSNYSVEVTDAATTLYAFWA